MNERSVRKLAALSGLELVHAAAYHDGHTAYATDSSLRCWFVDRRTGETEMDTSVGTFASKARLVVAALVGCP